MGKGKSIYWEYAEAGFKPIDKPRYLIGQMARRVIDQDLKMYNRHRFKIFTAQPLVDDGPPKMNPYNYLNLKKFVMDVKRLKVIDEENKKLVCKINQINRSAGKVDCWPSLRKVAMKNNWNDHVMQMQKIVKDNQEMYQRICQAETLYKNKDTKKWWKKLLREIEYNAKYPLVIMKKKGIDQKIAEKPSISGGMPKLVPERPRVYLVFQIKDSFALGRVIIELYSDYCPVTTENFLAICRGENQLTFEKCRVHNSLYGKYFETGDVTYGNGRGGKSVYGPAFPAEVNAPLKHTKMGVVSMIPRGDPKNAQVNSIFSITFDAMPSLDEKRFVFGKVIKGNEVLCKINDISRKVGLPKEKLFIAECGEYFPPRSRFHRRRSVTKSEKTDEVDEEN